MNPQPVDPLLFDVLRAQAPSVRGASVEEVNRLERQVKARSHFRVLTDA